MGRFRVFNHGNTVSSSDLNQRLKGNEMMKYLRQKAPDKLDNNVIVDYSKSEVVYFKTYQEFINATRSYLRNNPDCFKCADTPSNMTQGLHSELCYDELYGHVRDCSLDYCNKCEQILKSNDCLDGMFPYGHYNNNSKTDTLSFPSKVKIDSCGEKPSCPKYVYCKCPEKMNDKCCVYEERFPSQFKTVSIIKNPSNTRKPSCANSIVQKNINAFSIFPRIKVQPKKHFYQPKTTINIKKARTITKYNKELRRYEDVELSL